METRMTEAESSNAASNSTASNRGCSWRGARAEPGSTKAECGGGGAHDRHRPAGHDASKVVAPVCGMKVDPATSPHRFEFRGETYHFCSAGCRTKFVAAPDQYLEQTPDKGKPRAAVPEGAIYTCPMHPQIRQVGPGSCPICGMALEPELATLDAAPNPELADMTRRFWVGLALALPAVVLEMGGHLAGGHRWG